MGTCENREMAREVVNRVMSGDHQALDDGAARNMSAKLLGAIGEELAARYLEGRGYDLVDRNYRCLEGEADIVAIDPDSGEAVLVEVKTRRSRATDDVFPEEAVTPRKQQRYRRIAAQFSMDHYPCPAIRFDVIAVTILPDGMGSIRHLFGAFDWEAQ